MTQVRSLKFNFIVRSIFSFGEMGLSLLVFPYVAKVLGPENLGKFDYVIAAVTYMTTLCTLGTVDYGIRKIAKIKHDRVNLNKSLSTMFTLRFQLSLIGFLIYIFIVLPVLGELYNSLFWISAIIIIISFLNSTWILDGLEDYTYLAVIRILSKLLLIGYLRLFVVNSSDLYMYLYGYIFTEFLFFLASTIRITAKYKMKIKLREIFTRFDIGLVNSLLAIFFFNLLTTSLVSFPSLFLGTVGYFKEQGYYSVAMRFFWISYYCVVPMTVVLLPRSYRSIEDSVKQLSNNFIILITLASAVGFGLLSVSTDIIKIFVGNEYFPSIYLLNFLAFACIVIAFNSFWGMQVIFAKHKESLLIKSNIMVLLFMLILGSYLIYTYKSVGAVYSVLSSQLLLSILYFMIGKKYFMLDWDTVAEAIKGSISAFLMYLIIRKFNVDNVVLLLAKVLLGAGIFGISLIILRFRVAINILINIKDRIRHG
ncbi:oligosaccharide flippase family protein [Halobacteriovorax sp. DPLXC-1]|uniref:oligosaccharide flippase family protein n=1 Tax=Halobacteriovorax sp. DPLXC-1 TaxID=3110771 RepID=UPI002FF148FA